MNPPLNPQDQARLKAAEGFLQSAHPEQALRELDQVSASNRAHPEVLELWCRISAHTENWNSCEEIASILTILEPNRRSGWVHRGISLRRLGRSREAHAVLLQATRRWETDTELALHLAACCAALRELSEGRRWFEQALALAPNPPAANRLKLLALADPDLASLMQEDPPSAV